MTCVVRSCIYFAVLQFGNTAVMRASQYNHVEVVDYLVRSCKASVTTRNNVSVNYL